MGTNSGAVPESKHLQQQDLLPEVRMQRSALAEPAKKRGQQSGKKRQRSGKKGQKEPERVCKETGKEVQKERPEGCEEECRNEACNCKAEDERKARHRL